MPTTLPPLAFGNARAVSRGGLAGLSDAQRTVHKALIAYEPLGREGAFAQRSASISIGGLRLVASAHTPVRVIVDRSEDATLIVPFSGWSTAVIEGREYRWRAGRSAMYLPGVARHGEAGMRSALAVAIDPVRLRKTARGLAPGLSEDAILSLLATPQLVPLSRNGFSFLKVLRRVCGLIDTCLDQPAQLALLGLDEMLYRGVTMMLLPEPSLAAPPAEPAAARRPLDRACDHILAHLFEAIRLEDLEAASGLKARALQLAFRRRFGRSPREWIRDRRLDAARRRLAEPHPHRTITSVALECGFTRLASFSRAYAARFGEPPHATWARSQ